MKKINKNFVFTLIITIIISLLLPNLNFYYIVGIFLISYPYKIKGIIYSLFGGFHEHGQIKSLLGIIQVADKCVSLTGLSIYQKGYTTLQYIGVSIYQEASYEAKQKIGISFYQKARISTHFFGINIFQNSNNKKNTYVLSIFK